MTSPQTWQFLLQQGLAAHRQGSVAEAVRLWQRVLTLQPGQPDALHLLGLCDFQEGRLEEAERKMRLSLKQRPREAPWLANLGEVLRRRGDFTGAGQAFEKALALQPALAAAWIGLGNLRRQEGHPAQAEQAYRQGLALSPASHAAACNLALVLLEQGYADEAETLLRDLLQRRPDMVEAWNNLGVLLIETARHPEAIAILRQAVALKSDHAEAWNNLGKACLDGGNPGQAEEAFRRALSLRPDWGEVEGNHGNALRQLGRLDESQEAYWRMLEHRPADPRLHSSLLLGLHYLPDMDRQRLLAAHREWDRRHGLPWREWSRTHPWRRGAGSRLRLGFLSPDLGQHPVGFFLLSLLQHLDVREVELFCYSDRQREDAISAALKSRCSHWKGVCGLNDEALAEGILADGLDVMFDLAGHTAHNRLPVFARRVAPLQISWLGYVGTTGLSAMDAVLADARHIPHGEEGDYVEEVLRLPGGYIAYTPPPDLPAPVWSPPGRERGPLFGCFANPAKINAEVLQCYGRILSALPRSSLLFKYGGCDDAWNRQRIVQGLQPFGIGAERVIFRGGGAQGDHLARVGSVDVVLDTFPYAGGVTTCEALWMGVPMVSLRGDRFAARHGAAHLEAAGCGQWVADSAEGFVDKAIERVLDEEGLRRAHATLREQVQASPLGDGGRLAREFLVVVRQALSRRVAIS
ncbi:MAG: tetratricopeptide repeat protein [Magnetococcales bacterium]|nr:tetratricopeptide repeat protein [Magnetococcales bacterium]